MQQVTKDSNGANLEESDSDGDHSFKEIHARVRAHNHRCADCRNSSPSSNTETKWDMLKRVFHQHRDLPHLSDGSSGSIRRSSTYSTQDRAHLRQRSGGPVIRPRSKTYLPATVLHSKISQHSRLHGDSSIPTTISKDTTQGIEAKNKSLLATFGTKTKLLNPPLNPPLILDVSGEGSSQRTAIPLKPDSGTKDDELRYSLHTIGLAGGAVAEFRRMRLRQYRKKLKRRLGTHPLGFSLPGDGEIEKQHQLARNQPFTAQAKNIAPALNMFHPSIAARKPSPPVLGG